jgi:nickel/cobalt transporter (NicO) family protein
MVVRSRIVALMLALVTCIAMAATAAPPSAATPQAIIVAQAETQPSTSGVKPGQLLLQRRQAANADAAAQPGFFDDPTAWVQAKQREFYGKMSGALRGIRHGSTWTAAWTLMLLSFGYGVLHAAGPGHGKAVVSAWLLANERQLRRGILISFMAAGVQALTAIVLVSVLLLTVNAAARTAKSMALGLEAASFGLIALTGLWLVWQALAPKLARARSVAPLPAVALASGGHQHVHDHVHSHAHHDHDHRLQSHDDHRHNHAHDHHGHDHHGHHHHHDHAHDHVHDDECGCGHAHMPSAAELDQPVSLWKAASIAFAVGIRPCTGGILVLLFSSAVGLYWAGVAATLVMAVGTAMTVSCIAVLAVKSRDLALRYAGSNAVWLDRTAFGLKLVGGLFIACVGGLLFWAAATNTQPLI